jgi:hypothetical protein
MNADIAHLDDLAPKAEWLGRDGNVELWMTAPGEIVRTCIDCGAIRRDTDGPCPACRYGEECEPELEALEWAA